MSAVCRCSNWEGGIRVNAFVSGGLLPANRRGVVESGLIAGWDWYATYCELAGVDPTDHRAAAAGLPPIDSKSMWSLISGANSTSPRTEVVIGDTSAETPNGDGKTLVGGVIQVIHNRTWKLIVGAADKLHRIGQDVLTGPSWPNSTSHLVPLDHSRLCSKVAKNGCMFDLVADPLEESSLAAAEPALFQILLDRIEALQETVYSPVRGPVDKLACKQALGIYGGYWGPFLPNSSISN
jgi:arylsulfatase B